MLFKRLFPFICLFLIVQTFLRISLVVRGALEVGVSGVEVFRAMAFGAWFDVATASMLLLPIVFYHLLLRGARHSTVQDRRCDALLRFAYAFVLLFDAVAEHLFWTEFTTRFNFIAVDYLVYTQEVIGNITESYPLGWLIFAIAVCATMMTWLSLRFQPLRVAPEAFRSRAKYAMAAVAVAVLGYVASAVEQTEYKDNVVVGELSANGIYNLFAAFWNNEISYERFYAKRDDAEVTARMRLLLAQPGVKFVHAEGDDLTRNIIAKGKELHKNVILVGMESLSGSYMQTFGNTQNITPNLDKLAEQGLSFTNLYATGTRTVRGLEALTLSLPPTPGQSILRRPGNEGMFSLGSVFRDRGYDTKFIYGGYGYFDNMNAFFAGNGFDIIDRTNMTKEETQFANVWGICDEDMFMRSIREADASYAAKKPFFHLIMTTSNHRPYTYPEGRIDIPSKGGRLGGVKYADYSVGKLVDEASKKPWFKDTVFVFVADHTAGAGGKAELDPMKYHIPMIFYAPGFIKPQEYTALASQIDMAPTLLGLLRFSYPTKFYGDDVLDDTRHEPRAFISNYQKVAMVKKSVLTVLAPKRGIAQFNWPEVTPREKADDALVMDTISNYQSASRWREQQRRIETSRAGAIKNP